MGAPLVGLAAEHVFGFTGVLGSGDGGTAGPGQGFLGLWQQLARHVAGRHGGFLHSCLGCSMPCTAGVNPQLLHPHPCRPRQRGGPEQRPAGVHGGAMGALPALLHRWVRLCSCLPLTTQMLLVLLAACRWRRWNAAARNRLPLACCCCGLLMGSLHTFAQPHLHLLQRCTGRSRRTGEERSGEPTKVGWPGFWSCYAGSPLQEYPQCLAGRANVDTQTLLRTRCCL